MSRMSDFQIVNRKIECLSEMILQMCKANVECNVWYGNKECWDCKYEKICEQDKVLNEVGLD